MKLWMKVLIWAGLGGGIGFFAGYRVGACVNRPKSRSKAPRSSSEALNEQEHVDIEKTVSEAFKTYRGEDTDGDETVIDLPEGWENEALIIEEPIPVAVEIERTDRVPEVVPADIPQLHPQNMEPMPITAEEFNDEEEYEPDYERKLLDYYEGDEVLYDPEASDIIPVPEDVLGYGALYGFGGDPNNPVETIYIQNDTMGALYQVELVHGSFNDMIPGSFPPVEEEDEVENW